ncbi:MAG: TonB family protein [Saprospiraceae bacterium]|nr:TonB family protein [Saprospiraceae bacterium]
MKQSSILLLFLFTFNFNGIFAQQTEIKQDTVYLDTDGVEVDDTSKAEKYTVTKDSEKNKSVIGYTINGQKISECFYLKNILNEYNENTILKHGAFREWYPNGQLKAKGDFYKGNLTGELTTYYSNGKIKRQDFYKADALQNGTCFDENGNQTTYVPYWIKPEFKGGQEQLFRYLANRIVYPENARRNGIQGTVYVGFVVDKDGSITNVKVKKGVHKSIDEEALRMVKNMPKWSPGAEEGEKVRVAYTLPIKFALQ